MIAHEIAHVANLDILVTSIAAALATGISAFADLLLWMPLLGSDDDTPTRSGYSRLLCHPR